MNVSSFIMLFNNSFIFHKVSELSNNTLFQRRYGRLVNFHGVVEFISCRDINMWGRISFVVVQMCVLTQFRCAVRMGRFLLTIRQHFVVRCLTLFCIGDPEFEIYGTLLFFQE